MKKTLITLMALVGVAAADTIEQFTFNVTLDKKSYDGYKYTSSSDWVNLSWDNFSASNVGTDLGLLGITGEGNYGFNHAGTKENTQYGFGVGYTNDTLTLIGRSGVSQETLFASVVDVSSILGNYTANQLTSLSVSTTVTAQSGSDSWWGLYKMDTLGNVSMFSNLCNNGTGSHNDLREKTSETITLTSSDLSSIQNTDKLIVLYREASKGKSLSISSISYNASVKVSDPVAPAVPEPTTATLSLLALAGLAARRRRK